MKCYLSMFFVEHLKLFGYVDHLNGFDEVIIYSYQTFKVFKLFIIYIAIIRLIIIICYR